MKAFLETLKTSPSVLIAFASMLISLIGLWVSVHQTKLSNRHQLFEKRLKAYSQVLELDKLLSIAEEKFDVYNENMSFKDANNILFLLTDRAEFGTLKFAARGMPDLDDEEVLEGFLSYYKNTYVETSRQIEVLWFNQTGEAVSEFVRNYGDLIFALQQHKMWGYIVLEEKKIPYMTEELQEELRETERWKKVVQSMRDLKQSHNLINEYCCIERLKKTLKLGKR